MAERPIQGNEVVDPAFLDQAIKRANDFLAVNKELTDVLSKNLSITRDSLSNLKVTNSEGLKTQAKLTADATRELKELEVLKQAAAKTEIALAKVRIENDRALKQQIATQEAQSKQLQRTNKDVQTATSAYDNLRKKYNDLSRAQIELSVRGRENGVVFKAVKAEADALRVTLDKAEQGAGRFQRNVGNYASGFDSLGNSVNQITRELPAFAVSANTGFLAISNNLPILFDQLQKINAENAILLKQGKPIESVFSKLGGAIFSFGTVLSLSVTLLTLFGGKIVKAIAGLFDQADAFELNKEAMASYNEELQRTIDKQAELDKSIGVLQKTIIRNKNLITEAGATQLDAIDQLGDKYRENEKERLKGVSKIIVDQLRAGDKEVEIATRVNKDVIEIENKKTGEIIKLDRNAKKVLTQYSAFYNRQIESLNEREIQKKLDNLNKETKIFEQKLNDEYALAVENEYAKEGSKSKIRQKFSDEELIKKRTALDEIRQLEIDNLTDTQEREKQQVAFNADKQIREIDDANKTELLKKKIAKSNYANEKSLIIANVKDKAQQKIDLIKLQEDYQKELKKIEAENISPEEQAKLRTQIEIKTNDAILAIDKKFAEEQNEENKKAVAKTFESRNKIIDDNANFEIQQLERVYTEKQKTLSGFNIQEINNLEREISAKKVAQILADAEEKAALTKNEVEKEAIRNEARIKAEQETQKSEDIIKANRQQALKQALEFEEKILDAVSKAEAEKSKLRQDSFTKQITDQEKNIDTQRRLAERGLKNTLAEEEARKIQLERQKEDEKKREVKIQKTLAFFKLFSSYAETDPNTALQKALKDTIIAEAISGSFYKGTEKVEDDLKGNKAFNSGKDDYLIRADGKERIMTGDQNKMVGNMSNEDLAKLAYDYNNGFLDTVKYTAIPSADFAENVYESQLLHETIALRKEIQSVKQAIENKPVPSWDMTAQGDYIESRIEKGIKTRITYKTGKRI